jgi:hypothetical protein
MSIGCFQGYCLGFLCEIACKRLEKLRNLLGLRRLSAEFAGDFPINFLKIIARVKWDYMDSVESSFR